MIIVARTLALAATLALATACATSNRSGDSTLYQGLGERSGIAKIVEDLLYRIVEDDRIAPQFKGIDVVQFHTNLTDQICEISGGPCTYTGRAMTEVHEGMNVTETQFNALAEQLILAMEENQVSTSAQNRLLGRLVELHPDITHR
ncbi:hemoglobin [Marinobacter daqiaonensis]|uniref:Hemoglobin n=1 Tax=Marinobacter daqiaonensis TaxID=650891 RepID=A0A1I6IGK4_9GAMM|nr:group 1 truncated hemoglobin [Marinobacter daqiaonensis]SFR65779.1 hemoglobin [Marinobacter daqiaonensis]